MADMFGSPIGRSQAEQDIARMAILPLQMQKMQTEIAMAPFTAAQRSAQARHLNAKAEAAEVEMDTKRRIAAMAAGESFTPQDQLNPGWKLASLAQRAGDPDLAMKYATKAADVDSKVAAADTQGARRDLIIGRTRIANLDAFGRELGGVTDAAQLQRAISSYEQRTGERTGLLDSDGILLPEAATNWKDVATRLSNGTLSARDRIQAEYRAKALDSAERERKSKQTNRDFWQNMDNQRAKAEAIAAARAKKSGANVFDTSAGLKMGSDMISSEFVGLESAEARVRGRELAERAKQLRDANPALTPQEATREAFDAMDKGGKFAGLKRRPPMADPRKPLDLPASGLQKDLKVGFWYRDGSGQVRQWLGEGKGWGGPMTSGKIRGASITAGDDDSAAAVSEDANDDEEEDLLEDEE